MRMRGVLLVSALLVGIPAGTIYYLSRPRDDVFAIIGTAPYGAWTTPRSAFNQKPAVDITLPIMGRIRIPNVRPMPKDYVDTKEVSGLIAIDPPTKAPTTLAGWAASYWPITLDKIDFGPDGIREFPGILTMNPLAIGSGATLTGSLPNYAALPYLFGTESRVVTLISRIPKSPSVSVRLPGNGLTAPVFSQVKQREGPWMVTITPEKWLSPSFPLEMDFNVSGNVPKERLFVFIDRPAFMGSGYVVRSGESIPISWSRWESKEKLVVRVKTGTSVGRRLKVKVESSASSGKAVSLLWEDGKPLCRYQFESMGWSRDDRNMRGFFRILIGKNHVAGDDFDDGSSGHPRWWDPTGAKDGTILTASCYKAVKSGTVNITLPYPSSHDYRDWKEGSSF